MPPMVAGTTVGRRFRAYPEYRESGAPLLGAIPRSWTSGPLKRLVQRGRKITYGIVQCGPDVDDGVPYIRPVDMRDEAGVTPGSLRRTSREIAEAYRRSTVLPGDVVVSIGPSFGKTMVVPTELAGANLTQGTARVAPGPSVDGRYLFWCMRSRATWSFWDAGCAGATFGALTLELLGSTQICVPPVDEQQAIAAFLDRETAKIDALVARNERLIELLEAERASAIVRAVTKGLDSSVPLISSGIPSIGEVPCHWSVGPIAREWDVIDCKHRTVPFVEEGVPIVSIGEVQDLEVDTLRANRTTQAEAEHISDGGRRPVRHDVIYSRNATVGAAAIVATDEPMCLGQDVSLIRSTRQSGRYLLYQLRSAVVSAQLEEMSVGTTFSRINVARIKRFKVCIPSRSEQDAIAEHCDRIWRETEVTIRRTHALVDRLREYRSALITAAVGGQIDVRGEVEP